eukprot:tig00021071_g17957.t1
MSLPESVALQAFEILCESDERTGIVNGRRYDVLAIAALYAAVQIRGIPRLLREFLEQGDLCACGGTASFTRGELQRMIRSLSAQFGALPNRSEPISHAAGVSPTAVRAAARDFKERLAAQDTRPCPAAAGAAGAAVPYAAPLELSRATSSSAPLKTLVGAYQILCAHPAVRIAVLADVDA